MKLQEESSLEHLHRLLRNGHALTQGEIGERLNVTKRQVRRLLRRVEKAFEERGIPLHTRRRGREKEYHLAGEDLALERTSLSERQILALVAAAQAGRASLNPTPLSDPLEEALGLLVEQMQSPMYFLDPEQMAAHWHFESGTSVDLDPEVFTTLRRAMQNGQSARMDYYTASRQEWTCGRKFDPLLFAEHDGTWLCVAWCHRRGALRDFNLARMEGVRLCDPDEENAYFDPPDDFDPDLYFRERFGATSGADTRVVRLLVEPDRAPYFESKTYHPTQVVEEKRPDGRLVVSFEVAGLEGVRAFARSWGAGVRVLAPPELADTLAQDAKATARLYDEHSATGHQASTSTAAAT